MLKFLFVLLIFSTGGQAAAEFLLQPAALTPGGVALLCWQGPAPPQTLRRVSLGTTPFPLFFRDERSCALIGIDLDHPPGLFPLAVDSVDGSGEEHQSLLSLRIEGKERPAQRLTLPPQMVTPTNTKIIQEIARDQQLIAKVFSQRRSVLFSPPFLRPLAGEVISAFGLKRILNGIPKSPHNGIDFRAERGTIIGAMTGGEVALSENLYYTGKTVILDHGGGLFSLYAHLETITVVAGEKVTPGEELGRVGSTGRSTAPHLHMGTRLGQARIDPLALIDLLGDEKR